MHDPLEDLAKLTDALYEAELSKMQVLNKHEARLRLGLKELDEMRHRNQTLPEVQMNSVRQTGADVLWEGWIGRTRENLNTQLAQVLAQKARMASGVRRAFGKRMAAADLMEAQAEAASVHREKRRWETIEALEILRQQKSR